MMTWDGTRILLFSGTGASNNKHLSDTWIWDGTAWKQLTASGPVGREQHAFPIPNTSQLLGTKIYMQVPACR